VSGATSPSDLTLAELGLAVGARVRFRRHDRQRWKDAVVVRRERDGSVGLRDQRGAARAISVESIEVRVPGPRGGSTWVALSDWAARTEQLKLL
jgi:hypothetical protein